MAAEASVSGDELSDGSLFEGMVLFSPSDLLPSSSPPEQEPPAQSPSQDPLLHPPPPPTSPHPKSPPLDEDLFSDLSLQTPTEPKDPPPAISSPSRHIPRKKKRAFRIGYGREAIDAVQDSPHSAEDAAPALSSEDAVVSLEARSDSRELIEDELDLLRSRVSAKIEGIGETAGLVYAERKELERRRRKAGQDVGEASAIYKDLEKELEAACEAEDFERAERVSESLAAAEKEKDGLVNALRETELDCDCVDSRMLEVLQLQIAAEEEGIELLERFAKDAADRADLIHRNAEELSSKVLEDWQTSMELLETSKLEMDIEAKLISDARSALDSSIEDLVKDDREEVEGLLKKRVTLAKELYELLNLVTLKEAEIAENESYIHEAERKISKVASEFQETSSNVDMKHDNLKSAMSRIDSDREVLSIKKNEADEFISLEEQKCFSLRELANVALDEAKTCQDLVVLKNELASSILKSREDKVQLVRTEEKILEEIQVLRQQISSARTKLQELSSTRVSIQQDVDSFKQRIAFVDKRGPELEAEKKVAAAARNFKEAGRIASEAKALNLEKESMQNKMDKAVLNLEMLDGDIKSNISMIQENEELVLLKEKEAAIASFKRLQLIAAAARSERSAALELSDSEEGEFLLKEAEAAEERARELQGAYNLNPEDHGNTSKYFSPVALITKFSGHSLTDMAASLKQPVADE